MAMIEVGLEEFVDGLIAKKARGSVVDEAQRVRVKRKLLTIADRAVDAAIMNAVLRDAIESSTKKRMDRLHDLIQSGSKVRNASVLAADPSRHGRGDRGRTGQAGGNVPARQSR